jgi:hypothetical protein
LDVVRAELARVFGDEVLDVEEGVEETETETETETDTGDGKDDEDDIKESKETDTEDNKDTVNEDTDTETKDDKETVNEDTAVTDPVLTDDDFRDFMYDDDIEGLKEMVEEGYTPDEKVLKRFIFETRKRVMSGRGGKDTLRYLVTLAKRESVNESVKVKKDKDSKSLINESISKYASVVSKSISRIR